MPDVNLLLTIDQHDVCWDNRLDTFLLYGFPVDADFKDRLFAAVADGFADKASTPVPGQPIRVALTAKGEGAVR